MVPDFTLPSFQIPDFAFPFPLTYHKNGDTIAAATDKWFEDNCHEFTEDRRRRLSGLKAGHLTAYCYHYTDDNRLRAVCDFMNILFHLDDLSDGLKMKDTVFLGDVVMNAFDSPYVYCQVLPDGRMLPAEEPEASWLARDFWKRCIHHARPAVQARFCYNMKKFFEAVKVQSKSKEEDSLPDIETYMTLRRDQSGCRPCFDMMEYALDIELPDYVYDHPVLQVLSNCANDYIALTNDIFSYNVEQSRGDSYNLVVILMKTEGLDLQAAIDRIGTMVTDVLKTFHKNKTVLQSWGPEVDDVVARYIEGLENWIVGSLHWSYMSERYLGEDHDVIRETRTVSLSPVTPHFPVA